MGICGPISSAMSPSLWRDSVHLIGPEAGNETRRLFWLSPFNTAGRNCSTFTLAAVTVVGNSPGNPPIAMPSGSVGMGGWACAA